MKCYANAFLSNHRHLSLNYFGNWSRLRCGARAWFQLKTFQFNYFAWNEFGDGLVFRCSRFSKTFFFPLRMFIDTFYMGVKPLTIPIVRALLFLIAPWTTKVEKTRNNRKKKKWKNSTQFIRVRLQTFVRFIIIISKYSRYVIGELSRTTYLSFYIIFIPFHFHFWFSFHSFG